MRTTRRASGLLAASLLLAMGCESEGQGQPDDDPIVETNRLLKADGEKLDRIAQGNADLKEQIAEIEQREERTRLELARLERHMNAIQLATGSPKVADPPEQEAAAAKGTSAFNVFDLNNARKVGELYATGTIKTDPTMLKDMGTDPATSQPFEPRDLGDHGQDGDELVGKPLSRTEFVASTGEKIDLDDFKGKRNVVLVILRGFDSNVCIACSGQTLAISQRIDEFAKRDAQVYLVYPGKAETIPRFLDAVRDLQGSALSLPVDMLLDVDLSVVHAFKIEGRLAKPTTIIMDKDGIVRFAHVGRSKTDRPTVPQMLAVLDRLQAKKP